VRIPLSRQITAYTDVQGKPVYYARKNLFITFKKIPLPRGFAVMAKVMVR
jgi:hypothetical protein